MINLINLEPSYDQFEGFFPLTRISRSRVKSSLAYSSQIASLKELTKSSADASLSEVWMTVRLVLTSVKSLSLLKDLSKVSQRLTRMHSSGVSYEGISRGIKLAFVVCRQKIEDLGKKYRVLRKIVLEAIHLLKREFRANTLKDGSATRASNILEEGVPPDGDIVKIQIDGSFANDKGGIGVHISHPKLSVAMSLPSVEATANACEINALMHALQLAEALGLKSIAIKTDSIYTFSESKKLIKVLSSIYAYIKIEHSSRLDVYLADRLAAIQTTGRGASYSSIG